MNQDLIKTIKENYQINITNMTQIEEGTSTLYNIDNKYVLKIYPKVYKKQDIEKEVNITKFLNANGINTTNFLKTKANNYYFKYNEKIAVLEYFITGNNKPNYSLNKEEMLEAATLLGQIIKALEKFKAAPTYNWQDKITKDSFKKAIIKHQDLLNRTNNPIIIKDLTDKIEMLNSVITNQTFKNINNMTTKVTHGDYGLPQLIYENNKIKAIIDFIGAGYLPISWEIIRSYTSMDKKCKGGKIDINNLKAYIQAVNQYIFLTKEDLMYMPHIYLGKLLQSTFGYREYLETKDLKLLEFGRWRTKMCNYLLENLDYLSSCLAKIK